MASATVERAQWAAPRSSRSWGSRARSWHSAPLHPEAGLQNSASNRKWLTIAEKRALTWRSLPRPTLSTAVRILS